MSDVDVVIAGGGPAGMVAGLLLARAGLRVTVFEKHADFLRDFRGDTVHPSTLRVFDELGLLDDLLKRDHVKVRQIGARVFGRMVRAADFSHLPVRAPFIAMMPQWDLLDFIAQSARRYPGFELRQSCAVTDVVERAGRIAGVRLADGSVLHARLVIAADGRDSRLRQAVGATTRVVGAPMDVFWFRLPKLGAAEETMGIFEAGTIAVMIDRGSYWQCAWVFAKGAAEAIRARGIDAFRAKVLAIGPQTAGAVEALASWDDVKLLTVTVDRLSKWSRPGLLVIGDAAHAMSPIAEWASIWRCRTRSPWPTSSRDQWRLAKIPIRCWVRCRRGGCSRPARPRPRNGRCSNA